MITNTTSDLEEHLEKIDSKLETLSVQGTGISNDEAIELRQIQEERDSTQKCLDICAEVSSHIDQLQPNAFINISAPYHAPVTTLSDLTSPQQVVSDTFNACRESLANGTTRLERRLQDINVRLQNFSVQPLDISDERITEQNRLQEEREYIQQGLDICAEAAKQAHQKQTNVWEDISTAEDSRQFLVSTVGDLVSAKRITLGVRSVTVSGQMSDNSVQQLSHDLFHVGIKDVVEPQTRTGTQFEGRYGAGVKLSSPNSKGAEATRR
jgi:chromosome segregation ATPase